MIWIAPSSTAYLSARTSSGLPSLSPVPSCPLRRKWVATSRSIVCGCGIVARSITGQLVASQLFADDLVERPIGIERADDIVAVAIREGAVGVGAEVTVGIGIARRIQPKLAPALAVARRGQQTVDELLVCRRIGIVDESSDLFGPRRQARQVEADAADQGRSDRRRDRGPALDPRAPSG